MTTAVSTGSTKFAAFVTRHSDYAVVEIFAKPSRFEINFRNRVAFYETARRGAAASARKEVRKLDEASK